MCSSIVALQIAILLISFTGTHPWLPSTSLRRTAALIHAAPSLFSKGQPKCMVYTCLERNTIRFHRSHSRPKSKLLAASNEETDNEPNKKTPSKKLQQLQPDDDEDNTNQAYAIPNTGYSLADSMDVPEEFITSLTPILDIANNKGENDDIIYKNGVPIGVKKKKRKRHEGVARIDTVSSSGSIGEEPVRWLVAMNDPNNADEKQYTSYFMIDIPPYSDKLAKEIKTFMDPNYNTKTSKGKLDAILVTNEQCIHYDSSPGVYVTRTSDLDKWKSAFPGIKVIIYRLDQPRECRESVTQVLDGYGPWGWDATDESNGFVETGRPLKVEEWDEVTALNVLSSGEVPPDVSSDNDDEDNELYTKQAIRQREENHALLAVYTPGHTFGSITYIFPKRGICCSGYALPLESPSTTSDFEDGQYSTPIAPQGPRLDYQGYLATSVSRPRQMSSASMLINEYIDRFRVVLPARGDVVFLDNDVESRKRDLMESVGLYQKIGEIYGRLGIVE